MTIPHFQAITLPLLKYIGDQKEHSLRECIDALSDEFKLKTEERRALLPSGQQPIFRNRVGWARTYMKKAGLIESTRRGYMRITERGLSILEQKPTKIDLNILSQFKEFKEFKAIKREKYNRDELNEKEQTPEEILETTFQTLTNDLANDLLQQIKVSPPSLFEQIVVDLLVKMGYGGSRKDAGEAVGKTGDEGIDGIIKEDTLGLDIIYIQAKRWENTVSRPEIQKFAGALQGKHARKGIFITTSNFSKEAYSFAAGIETKIILIDGTELTKLMIEHNIGVSTSVKFVTRKIDMDYFAEE